MYQGHSIHATMHHGIIDAWFLLVILLVITAFTSKFTSKYDSKYPGLLVNWWFTSKFTSKMDYCVTSSCETLSLLVIFFTSKFVGPDSSY